MDKNKKRWVVSFWKVNAPVQKKSNAYLLAKSAAALGFKVKIADRSSFTLQQIETPTLALFRKTPH